MGRPPKSSIKEQTKRLQRELQEQAHAMKSTRSTSCLLCQKRKQKCDHRMPSCTACLKAGVECIQPAKYVIKAPDGKDEYATFLEKRIVQLEKLLQEPKNSASAQHHISRVDLSRSIFSKYPLGEFLTEKPVYEYNEQLARSFLDTYFTRLQFKYPLLDENEIFQFHNAYITNNLQHYMVNEQYFHFCMGRMWLVFSISACLHMTTGKYTGVSSNRYFATALQHIANCQELSPMQQLEILSLLVFYLIRTDRDSLELYDIMKDIIAICVKLKLHQKATYTTIENPLRYLKTFWCVYLLERMICVAVGKSYILPEDEIDSDLPMFEGERGLFLNQSLKLRRIESRFVERLRIIEGSPGRSDSGHPSPEDLPLVDKFFSELAVWRSNCVTTKDFENETLKLYYYRSVRLLIQPYLELMTPEDRLFRECRASAGHICQLYKVFHQKTVYGHSTPAVHTVFVAGVTLIYCLWLERNVYDSRRRQAGDVSKNTKPVVTESLFTVLDDLRACSVCLYVMTERSKFARIFRDTFDQLMNATIGNLCERCGPDSSEYVIKGTATGKGMPPAMLRSYGGIPHIGFVQQSQIEDDEEEVKERYRLQGVLQETTVPKTLSHLLSPLADAEHSANVNVLSSGQNIAQETAQNMMPLVRPGISPTQPGIQAQMQVQMQETAVDNGAAATGKVRLAREKSQPPPSLHQAMFQQHQAQQALQALWSTEPPERGFLNERTSTMINNISAWTGDATEEFNSLFSDEVPDTANQQLESYLATVPVEQFWSVNDDYGFLA